VPSLQVSAASPPEDDLTFYRALAGANPALAGGVLRGVPWLPGQGEQGAVLQGLRGNGRGRCRREGGALRADSARHQRSLAFNTICQSPEVTSVSSACTAVCLGKSVRDVRMRSHGHAQSRMGSNASDLRHDHHYDHHLTT
jgi:hypothetical protein